MYGSDQIFEIVAIEIHAHNLNWIILKSQRIFNFFIVLIIVNNRTQNPSLINSKSELLLSCNETLSVR